MFKKGCTEIADDVYSCESHECKGILRYLQIFVDLFCKEYKGQKKSTARNELIELKC